MIVTDALLVRLATVAGDASSMSRVVDGMTNQMPRYIKDAVVSGRLVHAAREGHAYWYLQFAEPMLLNADEVAELQAAIMGQHPEAINVRVSRLQKVFDAVGASAGQAPDFHYVVEMDPEEGWMPELSDWYDTEHMPGLAAVPGCIHAARYLNHDHGPLSLACYDLVTEDTKGSPPWMAMTHSEWSSRMRPHFTNTIRTMFQVVPITSKRSE